MVRSSPAVPIGVVARSIPLLSITLIYCWLLSCGINRSRHHRARQEIIPGSGRGCRGADTGVDTAPDSRGLIGRRSRSSKLRAWEVGGEKRLALSDTNSTTHLVDTKVSQREGYVVGVEGKPDHMLEPDRALSRVADPEDQW